jgi:hypothetical protein
MMIYKTDRFLLTYCLHSHDGEYIALNRNYKPIGSFAPRFPEIDYSTVPHLPLRITPAIAKKLSWNSSGSIGKIYLYSDSCKPRASIANWSAYTARLEYLCAKALPEHTEIELMLASF